MRALIHILGGRRRCRSSWGWVLSWNVPFCRKAVGAKEVRAETSEGTGGNCKVAPLMVGVGPGRVGCAGVARS